MNTITFTRFSPEETLSCLQKTLMRMATKNGSPLVINVIHPHQSFIAEQVACNIIPISITINNTLRYIIGPSHAFASHVSCLFQSSHTDSPIVTTDIDHPLMIIIFLSPHTEHSSVYVRSPCGDLLSYSPICGSVMLLPLGHTIVGATDAGYVLSLLVHYSTEVNRIDDKFHTITTTPPLIMSSSPNL